MKLPERFAARAAALDDAKDVAALMNAFDRAYLDEPDTVDAAEVAGWWATRDRESDVAVVHGPDDSLAAYGMLRAQGDEVIEADLFVHPGAKGQGLGGYLLDWLEQEALARDRVVLRTSALAADGDARILIESRGFVLVRHFYRMLIDLEGPPPAPVWPDGFSVSVFQPGEESILHAVTEEAFADHWGQVPHPIDEWQRTVFDREWWDPSLVYLVREGEEVVAVEINAVRFGTGWIGTLGTRVPWRGKGLGRALLLTAFGELYRRGERRIGLAVDAGNETGATHLYESVGMRVAWQADAYEKRR